MANGLGRVNLDARAPCHEDRVERATGSVAGGRTPRKIRMNGWRDDCEAIAMPHAAVLRIFIPMLQTSKTADCGTRALQARSFAAGDEHTRSYMMVIRTSEPALVLGLVSVLALSTATPSVAQTQRQRPAAQEQGVAPASPPAANAQHRGSCWIPTNDDFGVGYWGACSDQRSRPVK